MSMADRRAETEWAGTLTEGSGTLELISSGAAMSGSMPSVSPARRSK